MMLVFLDCPIRRIHNAEITVSAACSAGFLFSYAITWAAGNNVGDSVVSAITVIDQALANIKTIESACVSQGRRRCPLLFYSCRPFL